MPAIIQHESDNVYVIRLAGTVKRSEFGSGQEMLALDIDRGNQPRVLAILENFEGWEKGADWNDLDFQLTHGNEIAKIAIVGDVKWEPQALAFAGAGFRRAPVKFFSPGEVTAARGWLLHD